MKVKIRLTSCFWDSGKRDWGLGIGCQERKIADGGRFFWPILIAECIFSIKAFARFPQAVDSSDLILFEILEFVLLALAL